MGVAFASWEVEVFGLSPGGAGVAAEKGLAGAAPSAQRFVRYSPRRRPDDETR